MSLADRRLCHTLTAEHGTDGRFGWQSANMQAYNVVNEKSHITIADMEKFVAEKIAEKPIEVVFDIPKENKFGYASDTKMHLAATRLMALGWQPETDLEESYRRLIASMKNQNI